MTKYDLYVAGDCISQHEDWEEARKAFYQQVIERPDCPIDIMQDDPCGSDSSSLLAYDEVTEQVYNYK